MRKEKGQEENNCRQTTTQKAKDQQLQTTTQKAKDQQLQTTTQKAKDQQLQLIAIH